MRALGAVLGGGLLMGGLMIGTSYANYSATTGNAANSFATGTWGYANNVLADAPSLWWRLGESADGQVFTEDFEGPFNWSTYSSGTVAATSVRAHTGTTSLLKDGNNDPNGGWTSLGFTTGTDWTFEAWIYRPSGFSGGGSDRVALEDSSYNGYGVMVNHAGNSFRIERRTGGTGSTVASASFDPPEDAWYRTTLTRSGSSFSASLFDAGGALLTSVSGTDSTHGAADRFIVHGGFEYYVDDISVNATGVSSPVAVDTIGTLSGQYMGSPVLGLPSLVDGETDAAVGFDGSSWVALGDSSLLNIGARTERSAELWFRADVTTGRQVLYEEGGSTNGMVIYLDGSTLRARSWSISTSWSNALDTSAAISAGVTYHVVVTLDTAGSPNLILYLNGAQVDSESKSDSQNWSSHGDNGGIAAQNGSTRYHDGAASGTGSNGFDGTIDEVAIYNSVLPASSVLLHWSAGIP